MMNPTVLRVRGTMAVGRERRHLIKMNAHTNRRGSGWGEIRLQSCRPRKARSRGKPSGYVPNPVILFSKRKIYLTYFAF